MILIIKSSGGFGNKMFNIIIGLYIAYINGYKDIRTYIRKSYHDKNTDPTIFEIFPDLLNFYKITDNNEMDELNKLKNYQLEPKNISSITQLKLNVDADVVFISTSISKLYKFIYEMYHHLPQNMKDAFRINEDLISNDIIEKANDDKYATIHIRYGDKLNISLEKNNQFRFLIYTPLYYRKMIKKLLLNKYKIYIVTDDNDIVNKYIIKKINNPNIQILNISWWESFYLISKSHKNILSTSTFSFLATIINKHNPKAKIVIRPDDIKQWKIPEENIIDKTNWTKINNKKYILNYNRRLIKKMLKFRK